ncbi:MAG: hypothetical protein N838_15000 [Thiohalocapsa sp. PB-PSB1]|nr:MAG: hypothetical protein N838_15000 [Thiohalocapsa sp. PB-PSB1]
MVHILVELVEESLRPDIDIAGGVQGRTHNLVELANARTEKMQARLPRAQDSCLDGAADAVEHVVAMGLNDHLYAAGRKLGEECPHARLSAGVQVDLWIL